MSFAARRIAVLCVLGGACERSADRLQSGQDEALLARGVDTRASSYKDPQPPRTAPPPGPQPTASPPPPPPVESGAPPGPTISGETRTETIPGLSFRVPVEWTRSDHPATNRWAFIVPGPRGTGELVVYPFSATESRGWRARVMRIARSPEGGGRGEAQAMVRGPLRITLVDLPGAVIDQVLPVAHGRAAGDDDRLLGAIVEDGDVRYFFAFIGPAATVALWEQAFADFAASFAVEPPP